MGPSSATRLDSAIRPSTNEESEQAGPDQAENDWTQKAYKLDVTLGHTANPDVFWDFSPGRIGFVQPNAPDIGHFLMIHDEHVRFRFLRR